MRRFPQFFLLLSAGALLSACNFFTQPADLQTENLQNEQAETQIAAVRATATVNADRMLVTLENAQTAVGNIDLQSTRIASTLIAQGMPFVDASAITPVLPTDVPGSPIPQIANPLLTPGAPQVSGSGSARGDSPLIPTTPAAVAVQPTANPNGAGLTNIRLAAQVGSDDCPINPTTSFSSDATDIYVTAVANIQANATLAATFMLEGQNVKTYSWQPGFAVRGKCIWFHMPSSDAAFTPGNWTVTLAIDGAAVGAPIPFTIGGNAPAQINLTPATGG